MKHEKFTFCQNVNLPRLFSRFSGPGDEFFEIMVFSESSDDNFPI